MTTTRYGRPLLTGTAGCLLLGAAASIYCGGSTPASPSATAVPTAATSGPPAVLVGAGDIGVCGSPTVAATAALLDGVPGTVFTTGDNAYRNGTEANFRECYDPHWGRHRARTRPIPGNHEYETAGAAAYFAYFGANAGPAGLGYYTYQAGAWHVFALNSEIPADAGSAQAHWLRSELSRARSQCTLAYWHRPLFSSGPHGPSRTMQDIWRLLHEFDADVVLAGHEHMYERFAPQDADGRADTARGIRQFTVGTGGAGLYTPMRLAANAEAASSIHGVLKLTLSDGGYAWEFLSLAGTPFGDRGIGRCH
jgi:hypothetical protein